MSKRRGEPCAATRCAARTIAAPGRRAGYPLRQRVAYVTFLKAREAQRAECRLQVQANVQLVGQIGFGAHGDALLLEPAIKVLRDNLLRITDKRSGLDLSNERAQGVLGVAPRSEERANLLPASLDAVDKLDLRRSAYSIA